MNVRIKQMTNVKPLPAGIHLPTCILTIIMLGFVLFFSACTLQKIPDYGDIVAEDDIFVHYATGVVTDKRNNLMWAQADNGNKLTIEEAKVFASESSLAGFTDWRLPDIKELETLMVYYQRNTTEPGEDCSGNYVIHPFFNLTCCCPWALQDDGTRPASYPFIKGIATGTSWHHRSHTMGNRVLPVRDIR